jgi:hypothetical protein
MPTPSEPLNNNNNNRKRYDNCNDYSSLLGTGNVEEYRSTPWRWFILFYFSLSNCNQCLSWFSFSSTDEKTMALYFGEKMNHDTLDLLLNWGPIIGVLTFYPQTKLAGQAGGFKKGCWIGIILVLLGNVVRCIPIIVSETASSSSTYTNFVKSDVAFICFHVGQILIAAAGPFFMGTVTALSQIWFLENERTTATAIATTANAMGTTIGYLNPQWLTLVPSQIPNLFYFSLVLAFIPLFCALIYLPVQPVHPPSRAAALNREDKKVHVIAENQGVEKGNGEKNGRANWWDKLFNAGSNRSFVCLVVAASVLSGVQSCWGSLFQSILGPAGISSGSVSWIGFGNGCAQNIGAIISGWTVDKFFARRLKSGMILGLIGFLSATAWFTIMMWNSAASNRPSEFALVLALSLSGFFSGSTTPLFYELSAELIYPVKEGVSAGILVMLLNAASCITIFLNNVESGSSMNLIMTGTVLSVLLAVTFLIKEDYRRPQN